MATKEELIALALLEPSKDDVELNEVDQWIIASGIKPGKHTIAAKKLFAVYKEWADEPVKFIHFCRLIQKHLEKKNHYHYRYYLVDNSTISIPLKLEEDLKRDYFEYYTKANKERLKNRKKERNNNE